MHQANRISKVMLHRLTIKSSKLETAKQRITMKSHKMIFNSLIAISELIENLKLVSSISLAISNSLLLGSASRKIQS